MKRALPRALSLLALTTLTAACGSKDDDAPPADVHGNYTLALTNGASTCPLQNWTEGAQTSGVPVTITQNGSSVTATVGGAGAIFLGVISGGAEFTGTVSGTALDLVLHGTRSLSSGSCAFTIDAHLSATLDGDVIRGTVTYAPNTNTSPDCASVNSCSASQSLNGTRPPTTG